MTYLQHLEELRRRIIVSFIALACGFAVSWFFAWDILDLLKGPAGNITLHYLKPMEPFLVRFKLALFGGLILSFPVIIFEALAFVTPALKANEKKYTIIVVSMVLVFFCGGVVFGYKYIMPVGLKWLFDLAGTEMKAVLSAGEYVSFCGWFILAFGLSFETPLVIWMLVAMGVMTPEQLQRHWRAAVMVICVFAAIVTPDWSPVTMVLVAIPMILLYLISLGLARFSARRKIVSSEPASGT